MALDIGGMALRYADTVNTGAAAATGYALFETGRVLTEASGTYSQFFTGGASAQGALSGSYFIQGGGILTELGAFAGGSAHNDGTRTGQFLGNVRLHYMLPAAELFGGVGIGRSSFGSGAQGVLVGEIGAYRQFGTLAATFALSPVALDSINYADGQLSLSWPYRNLDLSALGGYRFGDQLVGLGSTSRAWGSLSVVAWVKPRIAAVLSAGSYPIDATQGFPGGKFASASIRFTRGRRREVASPGAIAQLPPGEISDSAGVEGFVWKRSGTRDVTLTATVAYAQSVEVTGDFTKWVPVKLLNSGNGLWTLTLPIAPGKYQMNLRVDGGKWMVPPGVLPLVDEFGGTVGLIIID